MRCLEHVRESTFDGVENLSKGEMSAEAEAGGASDVGDAISRARN